MKMKASCLTIETNLRKLNFEWDESIEVRIVSWYVRQFNGSANLLLEKWIISWKFETLGTYLSWWWRLMMMAGCFETFVLKWVEIDCLMNWQNCNVREKLGHLREWFYWYKVMMDLTWVICLCSLYLLQSRRCASRCTGNIINPSPWWTHGYSNWASACVKKSSCTWWSCTGSPRRSESYWKACGSAMCLGWRLQPTRLHETCSSSLCWTQC